MPSCGFFVASHGRSVAIQQSLQSKSAINTWFDSSIGEPVQASPLDSCCDLAEMQNVLPLPALLQIRRNAASMSASVASRISRCVDGRSSIRSSKSAPSKWGRPALLISVRSPDRLRHCGTAFVGLLNVRRLGVIRGAYALPENYATHVALNNKRVFGAAYLRTLDSYSVYL